MINVNALVHLPIDLLKKAFFETIVSNDYKYIMTYSQNVFVSRECLTNIITMSIIYSFYGQIKFEGIYQQKFFS